MAVKKTQKKVAARDKSSDNYLKTMFIILCVLGIMSLAVIGVTVYYLKVAPTTTGTSYGDVLTYSPDKDFIAEAKLFTNKANNGKMAYEFRLNYYTDVNIPQTADDYKNVYSAGIQLLDKVEFNNGTKSDGFKYRVNFCEPKSPIYYNSTNGTSYDAINQLDPSDNWIVDFSGDLGKIVQTQPQTTSEILWYKFYYRYDINALVRDVYASVDSLPNGKHILQFDFSQYFEVRKYDPIKKQFETDITTDDKFVFINVLIDKSDNGIIEANQSLFGCVNKDTKWSFNGAEKQDYWEAKTNYLLTLADFDFIDTNGNKYLKIKADASAYLSNFSDLVLNVVIDLDSMYLLEQNITVYGLAEDTFRGLNITSLSITSSTAKTLYYTGDLPSSVHLKNVILEAGDGT